MTYNTGSKDDWDHISRITEDPTWTWDAMAPYRDLNQRYVPPNDHHNDVSQKQAFSIVYSFLHVFPDVPVPPGGTQPQRDGIHQSSWVHMAY